MGVQTPHDRPQRPGIDVSVAAMWTAAGVNVALAAAFGALLLTVGPVEGRARFELTSRIPVIPLVLVSTWIGMLILRRLRNHLVGWMVLMVGMLGGLETVTISYGYLAAVVHDGGLPGGDVAAALNFLLALLGLSILSLLVLVFPSGHLPSPRWRWLAWSIGSGAALAIPTTVLVDRFFTSPWAANPFPVRAPRLGELLLFSLAVIVALNWLGAGTALLIRYRGAGPTGRRQIKWFLYGSSVMVSMHGLILLSQIPLFPEQAADLVYDLTFVGPATALLWIGTVGIAILRHRLYDIDLVISKTLSYGALAVFIGAVYSGVVVGLGRLVGTGGRPNTALAILATTVIAVAFQPVRERLEQVANRLVYGARSTPLEAVERFSESMSVGDTSEALIEMAQVVADATGARAVEIWLRVGDRLEVTTSTGGSQEPFGLPLAHGRLPSFPHRGTAIPIHHRDELLGAVTVDKPPDDPLNSIEHGLITSLAEQAGLVLRNRLLTEALRDRVAEVEAQAADLVRSRSRIVEAHDAERRRLERNIHDGAQQHLVAVAVKLGLARRVVERDPPKAGDLLRSLRGDVDRARHTITQLSHGLYPETLTRDGIGAALAIDVGDSAIPVDIEDATLHRHPEEIEAAAYFTILEAIQNAVKHSRAGTITVRLWGDDRVLGFAVTDDGDGFDPSLTPAGTGLQSITDRVGSIGGSITITAAPGQGTLIQGSIPAFVPAPA